MRPSFVLITWNESRKNLVYFSSFLLYPQFCDPRRRGSVRARQKQQRTIPATNMKKEENNLWELFSFSVSHLAAYFLGKWQSQWHMWGWHGACTSVQESMAGSSDQIFLELGSECVCRQEFRDACLPDGKTNVFRMESDFIVMLKQWMSVA